MDELKQVAGRFATPTLVIEGEVFIGFGANMARIRERLEQKGYLKAQEAS